jgi:hypothetical protein
MALVLLASTANAVEQSATTSAAEGSGGVDDWDWGAIGELDDAPVVRQPAVPSGPTTYKSKKPGEVENARPDFDAVPRPAYAVFIDAPPFEVIPSQRDADMHPCSNCHQWVLSDPTPRALKPPHDNFELRHGLHGKGKFWCFTCHHLDDKGGLKTLEGEKLEFSDAYVLCSQCHPDQARDWVFGAHGKRQANWQGTRQVYNCTACHYQHRPALRARAPKSGPGMRMGLERPAHWVAKDRRQDTGQHRRAAGQTKSDAQQQTSIPRDAGKAAIDSAERAENEES